MWRVRWPQSLAPFCPREHGCPWIGILEEARETGFSCDYESVVVLTDRPALGHQPPHFQMQGVEFMRPFTVSRVLVLIAVILFVLAALRLAVPLPVELVAAGLAFWAASQLV